MIDTTIEPTEMDRSDDAMTGSTLASFGVTIVSEGDQKTKAGKMGDKAWMDFDHETTRTINMNEITSLSALVAYVASISGRTEFGIEREFCDHFGIPNTKCLPAPQYDNAIRYLVDLVPAAIPAA